MEPYIELEQRWAEFNQLDPAGMVACASGTAALHLALESMQLPPGSHVITGDFNMIAVPRAISMAGLTPVFVDCDETLNMDMELTLPTSVAMIAVHIYGRQCNMPAIARYCGLSDAYQIEDLAEAHGVKPHPATNAACWSHYKNKIVGGEEGGTVWFRDPAHAVLARQLRSLGFTAAHDFNHIPRGHNYRMSNVHAEKILYSLNWYNMHVAKRRDVEKQLDAWCTSEWRMPPRQAPWVYDFRIPRMSSVDQNKVVYALRDAGISARHAFKPMHTQLEYVKCRLITNEWSNNAIVASREVVYLPLDRVYETNPFEVVRKALE